MPITIGQDATGRWAYMLRDSEGGVVSSHDNFDLAEMAMTAAVHEQRRLIRLGKLRAA